MTRLTFYGATGTVTGSKYLLDIDNNKLLIDCGLFQGPKENRLRNWDPLPVKPSTINRVLLTHAHIDHTGYLPRLCLDGFAGKVHSTHATRDLCEILLRDTAHLQEEDAYWANKKGFSKHHPALPLFTIEDAEKALTQFSPYHYGDDIFVQDDVRVKFRDAGHILGSAWIDIKRVDGTASRKILFSGDLGRPARPILRDPDQAFNVDYLIIESTYGDRLHEPDDGYEELEKVIVDSVRRGGVLVIPSFSVGRTQALIYIIRELEEEGRIPIVPIYVDSPMAIHATKVFKKHLTDQNLTTRILSLTGTEIYNTGKIHFCETREQSIQINSVHGPGIIISASGMATGGRILHHLEQRLPHPQNTILFIGYQAEGTRGRTILEGKSEVKIHGNYVPVQAKIEQISSFSGHADYHEILAWLMAFNKPPKTTFIVHGEPEASKALAARIKEKFGWNVVIPQFGNGFDLDF
ncbi:MBL fold metallo-hydrolase [candidate division KSB1 bacterium]|nr:MBL fold metallo-hydrolase [candidate division KSB1 bacterium]